MKLMERFDSWVDRRMIDMYEVMDGDHGHAERMREDNRRGHIVGYSHSPSSTKRRGEAMMSQKRAALNNIIQLRKAQNVSVVTIPKHLLDILGWDNDEILILSLTENKKALLIQKGMVKPVE